MHQLMNSGSQIHDIRDYAAHAATIDGSRRLTFVSPAFFFVLTLVRFFGRQHREHT